MTPPILSEPRFMQVYLLLHQHYGRQAWWPADSVQEVIIGAVLTQNTAWINVEKAITNLKQAEVLAVDAICSLSHQRLAELIRPSGYFNVKTKRLQALCNWLAAQGGCEALARWPTGQLREQLLDVYGIGPETADDIVLYAFHRPVFVIDAYTRRIFSRLGITDEQNYETLRGIFESNLETDSELFSEYHALIVLHAKDVCRKQPVCGICVLQEGCRYFNKC